MKAIIIDDMPLAIASLQADLEESHKEDIEIIGTANGIISGAKLIKKVKPDLVFLDIHMDDGDGFDLLEMSENDIKVIFTTASKEHAIKAFQFKAIDYLLKPIAPELLADAIEKAKEAIYKSNSNTQEPSTERTITLNTQEEIRVVKLSELIRLEAMGNYTTFFLTDNTKVLVTKTLKEFEDQLSKDFIRVHQSHLVNLSKIKSYIKTEGGYLKMKDGTDVPVSVRKKPYVMNLLRES